MDKDFLFPTFIFLAAACISVPLASRFKLGAVLGYLVAGVAIGPFGLGLIENAEQIMHFAEFGVVMMLFVIGLELEPAILWRMRKAIVGLGGLQVTITSMLFTIAGMALGYRWQVSLTAGMALALSSTALVLQMIEERNMMHTFVGETSFAVLLFQDIAVIPILIILPLLAAENAPPLPSDALSSLSTWQHTLAVAGIVIVIIAAGRYLSRHLFRFIARTNLREVFTATSLMLVVGITLLMHLIGLSPALGAFMAGVVLANSEYKHTLESDIEPFKGLLLGLFFISVGMGMNFALLREYPSQLITIVALLLAVKILVLFPLGRLFGLSGSQNIGFALALSQGGEFAFVLFQYAAGLGIIGTAQAGMLTLAVAISMATTPLLMLYYYRYVVPRFMSVLGDRVFDTIDEKNSVIIAGFGRFGQIIGRFLSAQGVNITVLEKDPDQIELLRKFGRKGYFGDATRLDLLHNAGTDKAKMLIIAVDGADDCLDIARMAKEHFPNLKIFARARNRRHAYELDKIGVDYFRRETFDSSLIMAEQIMVALGYDASQMQQKAARFMAHDEATLKRSFAFFDKEPELISFSRQASGELERILQEDVQDTSVK
jgi:glutathione-regulated potassium-efflux system ancillary protein KefC